MIKRLTVLILALILVITTIKAQNLIINEVQPANFKTYEGPFAFDPFVDWLEIKNTTSAEINLSGYFLSDDIIDIDKWTFAEGTTIPANGILVITAGGEEVETFPTDPAPEFNADFKLSSSGEALILSDPSGTMINILEYPAIPNDQSYGLLADGTYSFFNQPTPGTENDEDSAFEYLENEIDISLASGIYSAPQNVTINSNGTSELYYTLDGTNPDNTCMLYTAPIPISSNTILKVRSIESPSLYSIVENRSYIFDANHDLPIILLTSDNSSYTNNKEVINGRVEFCFIESDGTTAINQYANFAASGNSSQGVPQIIGKVKANSLYGDNDFDYQMFSDKPIDNFKSFLFRNASQDWANTHLRDAFVSQVIGKDNLTDTPYEAYRPAVIYVNAQYQGIINIREDDDKDYVRHNYGLSGSEFRKILGGDPYVDFSSLDFNLSEDRAAFEELVDFQDHLSIRLLRAFAEPGEFGWRIWEDLSGTTGHRFHYYFHDFDPTFSLPFDGANFTEIDTIPLEVNSSFEIFKLMEDQIREYLPYRNEALHFIVANLHHVLNNSRTCEILDEMVMEIESEIPAHASAMNALADNATFPFPPNFTPFSSIEQWRDNIDDLKTNITNAVDDEVFSRMKDEYELEGLIQMTYSSSDINKGFVSVHDVKSVEETFTGTYFENIPIRFSAEALPGYQFIRWEGDIETTTNEINPTFTSDANIVAIFEDISTNTQENAIADGSVSISPNPTNDIINIELKEEYQPLNISIINNLGQEVVSKIKQPFINGKAALDLSDFNSGIYFIEFKGIDKKVSFTKKIIKL